MQSAISALPHGLRIVAAGFLLACVAIPQQVQATHVVGGDLRYRCLGNNLYEIRLTMRRDCFLGAPDAQFDDPASVGFYNAQTNQLLTFVGSNGQLLMDFNPDDTLNQEFISDCTIAGMDVCVHQTTYVDTIMLPNFPAGYLLVYQRCCRNNTLQNIVEPLGTGMTLTATITHLAQQECNSSPVFGEYPPIYICVDDPILWGFSAIDVDGDSLVYELFTPFEGATIANPRPQPPPPPPYEPVVWADPFSLDNLLGGVPLQIDSETGIITGTPNLTGQFLVGVKVTSYNNNGELIDVTTREWQYNVRPCRDAPVAGFMPSVDSEILNCNTLTVSFTDTSFNAETYRYIFDSDNPESATSSDQNPTYTYPASGFYTVTQLIADVDSICFDTASLVIGVFEQEPLADFDVTVSECEEDIVVEVTDLSEDPNEGFDIETWQWVLTYGEEEQMSTDQNPVFVIDTSHTGVILSLLVTSESGCTAEIADTFDVNVLSLPFRGDTVGVCDGDTVALFSTPGPDFTYTWAPDETLVLDPPSNPLAFPTETTTYSVTLTDGLCEISGEVVVEVQELPDLDFTYDTDCRSLEVQFTNASTGGHLFLWDFGDGDSSDLENPIYTYETPGVYTVTLISADGCDVRTSQEVTVSIIEGPAGDDPVISCFAEAVVLNDGGNQDYLYQWAPGEFLDNDTIPSPTAQVDETTTFYVTITDNEFPGCSVVDSIQVLVPEDFDLNAPPDSSYCDSPEVTLTGGNADLDYVWLDSNGDTLAIGETLVVAPEDTTSYTLVGTDAFGCEKSETVSLMPTFFAVEVGPDVTICPGEDTTIFVTNLDPNQMLTYEWQPSEFIIGPNDVANPVVSPVGDQTFTVTITNMLGCTAEREVTVFVSDFDYTITPEELICLGEMVQLNITNNDTTDLGYFWTPEESIVEGQGTATPKVMPEVTTTYYVLIENNTVGCMTSDSVTVIVSWFDPGTLEIFVDRDSIIANDPNNGKFTISTNQDEDLDFQWAGDGINNENAPVIMPMPTNAGMYMYSVTVTNEDGCMLTGTTQSLTVIDPLCNMEDIFLPNAFSPNDDGVNDILKVEGNFITALELRIYNRWGEEVFVSFNQADGWDGTYNGELLAPDVFGYYMRVECPPDKTYFEKGNVTLFR